MADRDYGFRTRAIHAGNIPDAATGSRALPIYQTSAYVFDDTADPSVIATSGGFTKVRGLIFAVGDPASLPQQ